MQPPIGFVNRKSRQTKGLNESKTKSKVKDLINEKWLKFIHLKAEQTQINPFPYQVITGLSQLDCWGRGILREKKIIKMMISQAKSQHENINSPMKQIYELFPEDPLKERVT